MHDPDTCSECQDSIQNGGFVLHSVLGDQDIEGRRVQLEDINTDVYVIDRTQCPPQLSFRVSA